MHYVSLAHFLDWLIFLHFLSFAYLLTSFVPDTRNLWITHQAEHTRSSWRVKAKAKHKKRAADGEGVLDMYLLSSTAGRQVKYRWLSISELKKLLGKECSYNKGEVNSSHERGATWNCP